MSVALSLTFALGLPAVVGWNLLALAAGQFPRSPFGWAGRVANVVILGLGIASLLAFALLLAGRGVGPSFRAADAGVFFVAAVGTIRWSRRARAEDVPPATFLEKAALAVLVVALGFALWRFAVTAAVMPHGYWDAWEIWNRRARFIFRSGTGWWGAFGADVKGAEYPLLLPITVVRLWAYAGETTAVPVLVAAIFALTILLIVVDRVAEQAGTFPGAIAGLVLLGTPGFQYWAALQYADLPMAAFLVAAIGALTASERLDAAARWRRQLLAGLMLGLAGWTKNEGIAAAVITALVYSVSAGRRNGFRASLRELGALAAGGGLPAAAWLVFHFLLAPALVPALSTGQSAATLLSKLGDADRWSIVIWGLLRRSPGSEIGLPVVAVVLALVLGARPMALVRSPPLWIAVLFWLSMAVVFVVSPIDLRFHLGTAGDRLLLQAWPLFTLGVFGAIGTQGRGVREPAPRRLGRAHPA
jgi:hypothetical protein